MGSQEIAKAMRNISKASDCREDTEILTKAHSNWEEYLVPAPISIAFLGELAFISSKTDFSIEKGAPNTGFMFLKYPQSFRACLMQVCNEGWRAFNEAHKNMDKICLHTSSVPAVVRDAVKILLSGNSELVQTFLPDVLDTIADTANACVKLAKSAETKFTDVTDLISELLESCTSAKQSYGARLIEVRNTIEEEKLKKKVMEAETKLAKEAFERYGTEVEKMSEALSSAMDSLPTGWDLIGMNFVEGLSNSLLSSLFGFVQNRLSWPSASTSQADMYAVNEIACKSPIFLSTATSLMDFIENKTEISWSKVLDEKTGESSTDVLKTRMNDLLKQMESVAEVPLKTDAERLCRDTKDICHEMSSRAQQKMTNDPERTKEIIKRVHNLMTSAQKFDSTSKSKMGTPAIGLVPPGLAKAQRSQPSSTNISAVEMCRFKLEQVKAEHAQVTKRYEESLKKMEEKNRALIDILVKMRSCEIEEIDFDTTIKLLATGLQAMGTLQEKWRKMVQFFQMVSTMVDTHLKKSLMRFAKTAGKSEVNYSANQFLIDMIYQQTFQASNISNLVNMISGTYTEISNKFLMDRVGSLSRLMTLDPTNPSFQSERMALASSCDDASNEIRRIVIRNQEEFKAKTKARQQKIENELNAVLPLQSEADKNRIHEVVVSGYNAGVDPEDLDQYE